MEMEDKNKLGKAVVGWLIVSVFAAIALLVVFSGGVTNTVFAYGDDFSYLSSAKEVAEKIEKEKNMYISIAFIGSAVFFGILIAILVFVRKIYGVLDRMRIGLESKAMPSLDSETKGGCDEKKK